MIAWTVAGSDSGGGAGIQADLRTFHGLGVHGCSVITALTAQNTQTVAAVERPSLKMIRLQMDTLAEDLPPAALKLGMLGDEAVIQTVARRLETLTCPVVCDPVMVATSGGSLLRQDARKVLVERLFPRACVITPNLPEAEALLDVAVKSADDMERAAAQLLEMGANSVLLKGGHGCGEYSQDFWTDGERSFWLTGPRRPTPHTHGSGCTLSSAIAAALALGYDLENALVLAKAYVSEAIGRATAIGGGYGPVHQGGWPRFADDFPWLSQSAAAGAARPRFADCGPEPLGFYPIVDRAAWLERLLPLGVRTAQLRIKDLRGIPLEREIEAAVRVAEAHRCRLFINDYWRLAIQYGAYGVHLGQEDLTDFDPQPLLRAGLRLGISTHDLVEAARALSYGPSYVALGPIYPTTSKPMRFGPQGLERLKQWRNWFSRPLVAIGGINLERAPGLLALGVDAVAVISALTRAADPEAETRRWLKLFDGSAKP